MAGQPTFRRAKRFTYFHTDYHTIYEGALTQHVKTNLTASIDGDYDITADAISVTADSLSLNAPLDLNQQKITNVENVLRSIKTTVPYTVFTATSRKFPQNVPLFRASPGDTIFNVCANMTTAFAVASLMGTGLKAISRTHVSVGDLSATGGFRTTIINATETGWRWQLNNVSTGASMGAYLKSIYATPLRKTYLNGTLVNANFRASENFLASLDQGSIDFYVDVMSRS